MILVGIPVDLLDLGRMERRPCCNRASSKLRAESLTITILAISEGLEVRDVPKLPRLPCMKKRVCSTSSY